MNECANVQPNINPYYELISQLCISNILIGHYSYLKYLDQYARLNSGESSSLVDSTGRKKCDLSQV